MTSAEPDLKKMLRSHFRNARHPSGEHPTLEDLAAYHAGELSPEEDEAIRGHLVECEDCAAIVLELVAEPAAEAEVSDFEVAAAWRRQKRRLLEHGTLAETEAPRAPAAVPWAWATAAMLAFVTVASSLWVANLRQTVQELRTPQINPPVVNLEPLGSVRDPASPVPVVELSPGASRGWLILNLTEVPDYSSYRVEFVISDGRTVWVRAGLQKSEAGNFRLELTKEVLPPADYRIGLAGLSEGRYEPVAEYSLRISEP